MEKLFSTLDSLGRTAANVYSTIKPPAPVASASVPAPSTLPTWLKPALIIGGVIAAGLLLWKLVK